MRAILWESRLTEARDHKAGHEADHEADNKTRSVLSRLGLSYGIIQAWKVV